MVFVAIRLRPPSRLSNSTSGYTPWRNSHTFTLEDNYENVFSKIIYKNKTLEIGPIVHHLEYRILYNNSSYPGKDESHC